MLPVVLALDVLLDGGDDALDGGAALLDAAHQLAVSLLGLLRQRLQLGEDGADLVVHDLQPVVQVGELRFLRLDGLGQRVWEGLDRSLLLLLLLLWRWWRDGRLATHFLTRNGVRGRDDKFLDLEGVWVLGRGGGDAEIVSSGEFDLIGQLASQSGASFKGRAYLVALEAGPVVYGDLKAIGRLFDLNGCEPSKVAVRKIALAKREGVKVVVVLEGHRSIVQKPPKRPPSSLILIQYKHQPIELLRRVKAGLA